MISNVAFLCEGKVYLRREPILLQEWPKGDSPQEEGISGAYHRLIVLTTSSVRPGTINEYAQGDSFFFVR